MAATAPHDISGHHTRGLLRLAWRRQRTTYLVCLAAAVVFAVYAVVQHHGAVTYIESHRLADCTGSQSPLPDHCAQLATLRRAYAWPLRNVGMVLPALPVLCGVLLGAPLIAQEWESGTYRMVWSQSVSRVRWLVVKLALAVTVTALATGVVAAAVTWWWLPVSPFVQGPAAWYGTVPFLVIGPLPVALGVLSVLVGAAAGVLLRRTVPAMAVTLGIVGGLYWALDRIRGGLWPVATRDAQGGELPDLLLTRNWTVAGGYRTASGDRLPDDICGIERTAGCLRHLKVTGTWAEFHPPSHFWPLQATSAVLCLLVAVIPVLLCIRRIRRGEA